MAAEFADFDNILADSYAVDNSAQLAADMDNMLDGFHQDESMMSGGFMREAMPIIHQLRANPDYNEALAYLGSISGLSPAPYPEFNDKETYVGKVVAGVHAVIAVQLTSTLDFMGFTRAVEALLRTVLGSVNLIQSDAQRVELVHLCKDFLLCVEASMVAVNSAFDVKIIESSFKELMGAMLKRVSTADCSASAVIGTSYAPQPAPRFQQGPANLQAPKKPASGIGKKEEIHQIAMALQQVLADDDCTFEVLSKKITELVLTVRALTNAETKVVLETGCRNVLQSALKLKADNSPLVRLDALDAVNSFTQELDGLNSADVI
jgi:hypothetical protein